MAWGSVRHKYQKLHTWLLLFSVTIALHREPATRGTKLVSANQELDHRAHQDPPMSQISQLVPGQYISWDNSLWITSYSISLSYLAIDISHLLWYISLYTITTAVIALPQENQPCYLVWHVTRHVLSGIITTIYNSSISSSIIDSFWNFWVYWSLDIIPLSRL